MPSIMECLDQAGVFFLATTQDGKPRLRPISDHFLLDGRLMFCTGSQKAVCRQMRANPWVEISALAGDHWLRYSGRVVFETDPKYEAWWLENNPEARGIYNEETGWHVLFYHLEDAVALLLGEDGEIALDVP